MNNYFLHVFLRQEFFLADSRAIIHENKKYNLHFGFYDKYRYVCSYENVYCIIGLQLLLYKYVAAPYIK